MILVWLIAIIFSKTFLIFSIFCWLPFQEKANEIAEKKNPGSTDHAFGNKSMAVCVAGLALIFVFGLFTDPRVILPPQRLSSNVSRIDNEVCDHKHNYCIKVDKRMLVGSDSEKALSFGRTGYFFITKLSPLEAAPDAFADGKPTQAFYKKLGMDPKTVSTNTGKVNNYNYYEITQFGDRLRKMILLYTPSTIYVFDTLYTEPGTYPEAMQQVAEVVKSFKVREAN